MAEQLPPGIYDAESVIQTCLPNGLEFNGICRPDANSECHSRSDSFCSSLMASSAANESALATEIQNLSRSPATLFPASEANMHQQNQFPLTSSKTDDHRDIRLPNGEQGNQATNSNGTEVVRGGESRPLQSGENGIGSGNTALTSNIIQVEAEWIEQYEPGVYITLMALRDGTRDLKRVRFR